MRDGKHKPDESKPEDEFKTHPDVLESINRLDGVLAHLVQLTEMTNEKVDKLLGFAEMVKESIEEAKQPIHDMMKRLERYIRFGIVMIAVGVLSIAAIALRLLFGG